MEHSFPARLPTAAIPSSHYEGPPLRRCRRHLLGMQALATAVILLSTLLVTPIMAAWIPTHKVLSSPLLSSPPHSSHSSPEPLLGRDAPVDDEPPVLVTGVVADPGPNYPPGTVPLRREVRDLKNNYPYHWNLFLLGMKDFQAANENDPLSYYQIAGIHGRPFKSWNGVASTSGIQTGYCTHGTVIFLTWHRPYLALFELLFDRIQRIAGQYSEPLRSAYIAAAREFRLPYWDSGVMMAGTNEVALPNIFWAETTVVQDTDGVNRTVPNPLHHFSFHPLNQDANDFPVDPWNSWNQTLRHPQINGGGATTNTASLMRAFDLHTSQFHDMLGIVMTSVSEYNVFSSTTGGDGHQPSLENVHNEVHNNLGGQFWKGDPPDPRWIVGHMTDLGYSAYEPMFWLHHANVDRWLALFQAIHPDTWVKPQFAPQGTFTIKYKEQIDENTSLTPFRYPSSSIEGSHNGTDPAGRTSSTFWTSALVRNTTVFHYAYPETQRWLFNDTQAYQTDVNKSISRLYGLKYNGPSPPGSADTGRVDEDETTNNSAGSSSGFGSCHNTMMATAEGVADQTQSCSSNVHPIFTLSIQLSRPVAPYNPPVQLWFKMNGEDFGSFNAPGNVGAGDSSPVDQPPNSMTMTGVVPLMAILTRMESEGKLISMNRKDVTRFVKQELSWGAAGPDYTPPSASIDEEDIIGEFGPGLKAQISLVSANALIPQTEGDPLVFQSGWKAEADVTKNKVTISNIQARSKGNKRKASSVRGNMAPFPSFFCRFSNLMSLMRLCLA